jgi:sigma-B regulation protein RsbU (phosphoserine phosphatase)
LTKLNGLLVADFPVGKFVTLVYAVLDPATRTITFANAGHLHPLFIDASGARFIDTERGLPLGISCGDYSETSVNLSAGSRLVFYSDGITEAVDGDEQEYGLERLAKHATDPSASAVTIVDDVRAFANGAGVRDDATVVFVGVQR